MALIALQVPSYLAPVAKLAPRTAAAATYEIGKVAPAAPQPPSGNGCTDCTLFQRLTDAASPSYAAPADGTITKWYVEGPTDACTGCAAKLRVFRQIGPTRYMTIGESAYEAVGTGLQTFTTNIAVKIGDLIGIEATNGIRWYAGNANDAVAFLHGIDPVPGTSFDTSGTPFWDSGTNNGGLGQRVNVEATLETTHRISGFVYGANNVSLSNLSVRVNDRAGGATVATTTTNSDGFYSVTVENGSYDVSFIPAQGSGYAVQLYNGQISTATSNAVVVAGADVSGIDGHLVTGRAVTGTVKNSAGAAIAGVTVDAYLGGPSCCYFIRSTTTAADGSFLLELAEGATYKVRFARNTPQEQWWNGHNNPTNDVLTGWSAADAFSVATTTTTTTTITGCQPGASPAISYTNWNRLAVSGGGTSPTFSVSADLCAMEIDDYHWNGGNGATPGTIGLQQLIGGNNLYGPLQATGSDPQGSLTAPYVNWFIRPTQGGVIWILQNGSTYRCLDSDGTTWSQNAQSNGQGFCQVWTVPYGTFTTTTSTTTYGHANTNAVLANGIVAGVAECRYTSGNAVSTVLLPGATVQLFSGNTLVDSTLANGIDTRPLAAYFFTGVASNATYTMRYTGFPYFPALVGDVLVTVKPKPITCDVTFRTDSSGTAIVPEPTPLLDRLNHTWFRPYHLTPGVQVVDVIPTPGVSTWYRVRVKPHQRLTFRLTNPPTQYTVLAFTDLYAVARDLLGQDATLDQLRLLDGTQDRSAPDLDSPDLDSPDLDSPDLDSPDLDSPDLDSPDLDSPDLDSPDLDSPDLDSPDLDSPDLDSPDLDSGGNPVPIATELTQFGPVYVAAQRHGLRAFSAQPGDVNQTIIMNTRDYQGDVYFRVRPHGDLSSSDLFSVTATTEGGAGCINAPLVVRAPSLAAPAGTYKTLVITNTAGAWFTGQTAVAKADFSAALASFAQRSEVNGAVVDLAGDANLQASFADWAANPTCVAQANDVARSLKQLIDQARAHGIEYVVLAGPDPAVPFFRTRDDAELSKESRYSGGLDALSPLETALTEDYVVTDSFYGASGPTTRSGHDFYLSSLAIGRLVETPTDIVTYLNKYGAASGKVSVQRAFSSGYGFVSDLASYETNTLHGAGATVDTLNNDTWSSDDLRGFLFGAQHYQLLSLQGHGRADRLVPADDGTRLLSSEISAVNDGRFAGTFVMSLACHYTGYDVVQGQQLGGTTPFVSFPSAFLAQGATAVGETGFGYGHDPLLKNGEVVMADLADEFSYTNDMNGVAWDTTRGVPVGKALNNAKLRFLNSLADVRGIEAKVINETVVYGAPMFSVKMPSPSPRPTAPSVVGPLTTLTGTLASGDATQTFDFSAAHKHTLGAGSFYDAGSLNDTATFAFRPIVPSRVVGVGATNTLPRGAVLLSGTYQDTTGFVPALAVPATQDGTTNPPTTYTSTSFAPGRLIRLDEFAGDAAVFVPFQFQGNGASGIARTFSSITARLYYSTLTGDAALVDAPGILSVSITRDATNSALARVTVTLSGRATPDIQDVWATYTGTSAPLAGKWQSVLLTGGTTVPGRAGTFTRAYTGTIDPQGPDANTVLVDIQAVGGNGLVSYGTNGGLHYRIVDETASKGTPKRTPLLTLSAPSSATYRSRITVSTTLTDQANGAAIDNKKVTFKLAGSYATALTNASGVATATLVANVPPDPSAYHIVASVNEDLDMLANGVETNITVSSGPTQITTLPGVTFDCSTGATVGNLKLTSRQTALPDERVTLDIGGGLVAQTYTNKNGAIRFDAADFGKLAPAMYSAALRYAGQNLANVALSRFTPTTANVSVKITEKAVVTLNTTPQPASAPVVFGGAVQQGAAIDPACLVGDITTALVHYVVTSENGTTVATDDAPVTANADGNGSWTVTATLPAGVYTVSATAAGFYTSANVSGLLPVFDPSTFVTGGGYVTTSATNSTGLVVGKKANFGFNLKYKTGTTIPTGSLLFQAAESKVDFKATSFDWLVITTVTGGERAEFQGSGTVNGASGWTFHVVTTDLGAADAFEIQLTNTATGATYYVSGSASGGNIVIH